MKLTKGPILKPLLYLTAPITLANVFQTLYQMIDMYWVGRLGKGALAAVSAAFPLLFIAISFSIGLTMASNIMVSHAKGEENKEKLNKTVNNALVLAFAVGLLFSFLGYMLAPWLLSIYHLEKSVYEKAVSYLKTTFLASVFLVVFMTFQGIMRGVAKVKVPLYIVALSVVLNAILDPYFIFNLGLGVEGAAWATVITRAFSAIVGIFLLFKEFSIELTPSLKYIKELVKLGLPGALEYSSRSLVFVVLTSLVSAFGTVALASFQIGIRVWSFAVLPAIGLSAALVTMVGQNKGAKQHLRIKKITKVGMLLGIAILVSFGILMYMFAYKIAQVFIPNDLDVVKLAGDFIRILTLGFAFTGAQMSLVAVIRGLGKTFLSMILSMVHVWLFRVPLAFILSKKLGFLGIAWAFPISDIFGTVLALIIIKVIFSREL